MSIFNQTTKLRALLLSDKGIAAKIKGKIFPITAPFDTKGTFVVYQRDSVNPDLNKMGQLRYTNIILTIVSDDYDEGCELAEMIDKRIGHQYRLEDSTEDKIEEKFIQVIVYKVLV